ncbi:YegP family protein [Microbacterium kunmingense]|uniref:YegP family protein n=1 Tax=Microbacterium kunmingense TaxID=2915939 RepID=UPI0020044427|nr:DUF1508 domain-containing protein [Microbacterium kunmingense]
MTEFEVYQRADGKWAWRLKAANGEIVATDGGQGYEHKDECERTGARVVVGLYAPAGLNVPSRGRGR